MKRIAILLMIVFLSGVMAFGSDKGDMTKDKEAIKKVILSAYRDGIGNVGDPELMKQGFHPVFNLIGQNKDKSDTWVLPIDKWMKSVEKRKAEGKYPPKEKISFKFPTIDIVGTAAVVKVKFFRGEKLAYTDFLSLYKFKDGWKIVAKIYYQHPE